MQELVTLRILWVAILSSSLLLLSVLLFVGGPGGGESTPITALCSVAAAGAVGSIIVPRALHTAALHRLTVPTRDEDDPEGFSGVSKRRVAMNPREAIKAAFLAYQAPFIVGLALAESVALFGFVLGFLGAPLSIVVPLFVASWILIASRFPTVERVVGPLEQVTRVRIPRPDH